MLNTQVTIYQFMRNTDDKKEFASNESRRAKLGQIQGGGCRRPVKIRQRGGFYNCLPFTR